MHAHVLKQTARGGTMHEQRGTVPSLVLGIISASTLRDRRHAIRETWLSTLPPATFAKFVVRAGRCGQGTCGPCASSASFADSAEAGFDDVLPLPYVCEHEPRERGAVLAIHAWIQHAVSAFPAASYIGKTDDDIWLDVPMLHRLMRVVHVKHSGSHTLVGNLLFTSWVEELNHAREYDLGFGYNCYGAFASYNRRVKGILNDNRTSLGPFVFPTGMLTVLSYSLAAELAGSASLTSSLERVASSAGGRFGLEDKWLGSALQRFRRPSKLVLVALHGDMISDTYGVHVHTSTLLYHSRVKDVKRFSLVQNFSRMHGCSAAPARADASDDSSSMGSPGPQGPVVSCQPTQMPCVPRNSTFCTVEPTCKSVHYMLNYSAWNFNTGALHVRARAENGSPWIRCTQQSMGGTNGKNCIKGVNMR